jgi:predicted regulator of amino acid metabolism with ACT domain
MQIVINLLERKPPPKYQTIAERAARLSQLGLSEAAIARSLGVDRRTVRKAVAWFLR